MLSHTCPAFTRPRRVCFADGGGNGHKLRHGGFQIVGEEAAVRAGIGAELLFIEGLQVVKRLLGGIAEAAVGLPLERGQVVELRRFLRFLCALHRLDRNRLTGAGGGKSVRLRFFFELFGHGGKIAAAKIYRVKGFRTERPDLFASRWTMSASVGVMTRPTFKVRW